MNAVQNLVLPIAAVTALFAPHADAQGLELHFGKHTKHGHVSIGYVHPRPAAVPRPCPPPRVWVPGHYETRCQQVWIPGESRQVFEPAVYEWRYDACGRAYQVCVRAGFWRTECSPGRYETREVQVWVDGCWR
ncbi:MAG: hypothetical protein U1F29_13570 [Planctomycetota bacterium]